MQTVRSHINPDLHKKIMDDAIEAYHRLKPFIWAPPVPPVWLLVSGSGAKSCNKTGPKIKPGGPLWTRDSEEHTTSSGKSQWNEPSIGWISKRAK